MDIYVTCLMYMLSTWELRGGPEDARVICFMFIAHIVKY